ncbi:MAG: MoxR family ATPase [Pseudomonadota bacterium]
MSINTTPISAGRALEALRTGFQAQTTGQMTLSWMLHGRPGIGKTEIVQQLAAETGARLFDLRLTTIEPQDLRGLPFYDHDAKRTVWYPPEDLPADPAVPAILFLDELTAAAPALQPTVYGLLQERRVGQFALPACTFIIAAGNTVEDGAIAYEMGTALSDRLVHLSLRAEARDWIANFAVPQGMHPSVTAFISTRPDMLDSAEDTLRKGEMIACTPRSWARVSAVLNVVSDKTLRDVMIAGIVGEAAAAEFILVAEEVSASVQATAMLEAEGRERLALYPTSLHGMTALVYALIALADETTMTAVIDVLAEVRKLPARRPQAEFAGLPLGEMTTYGFELLIEKALAHNLQEAFRTSKSYSEYLEEREAAGSA